MRHTLVLSALLGSGLLAATMSQAANNSLVFCSEGSPAGFDTAQYTTATDNDAAEPLYNRLVEFEKGATNVVRAWPRVGIFPRTASSTPSTFGVKFHTTSTSTDS
jgi:dipeptide transport system substrate-binding protein